MSIKPLSKETIKLINSTQVISSIYSAIKELVENSLDAQAQNIEVNLTDNGLSLIEVKDNGTGISKQDAQFMALPAYTSKITDFNDLDLLKTYGFRGEGLSAVCRVSDVTVSTKTEDDETMTHYVLDNDGNVVSSEVSHGLRGTSVQMRNLFRNLPVRRNILNNKKRINQELKAIEILLKTYAICQPSIRFIFRVNSNIIFTKFSCKSVYEAFKAVIGVQTFSKLIYMKKDFIQTELQLFVPKKDNADCSEISQTGYQFLCVNDRPIKSKEIEKKINKRISEYFNKNTSSTLKFIFCVNLKVDPSMLDVNLEPNKDKVFLQNEAVVLKEIDDLLLNLYELQDSQISTQCEIENRVSEINLETTEKEKEWPACKKRRMDSQNENIISSDILINAALQSDQPTRKSDDDFLKAISDPKLSDDDSNDADNFSKKKNNQKNRAEPMEFQDAESSEMFDFAQKILRAQDVEETLSQLPKVDLGEDFDWQEIINKDKSPSSSNHNKPNQERSSNIINHQIDDMTWSKGLVPGLQGGVVVSNFNRANTTTNNGVLSKKEAVEDESETFDFCKNIDLEIIGDDKAQTSHDSDANPLELEEFQWDVNLKNTRKRTPSKRNSEKPLDTSLKSFKKFQNASADPKQSKIVFAGDNACLKNPAPSAFAMFCANERAKIVRKYPELSPAEVAAYLNTEWKEMSSDEREYYRDLANQHIVNAPDTSLTQTSRKPKSQVSQDEKEKNKKQFVCMLGNMKRSKAEIKNESMIMRKTVDWTMNLPLITEKFRTPTEKPERSIVGSLNSLVWILYLNLQLVVFDITELHAQLNIEEYDINQINSEYVKIIVDRWFNEKNDMSVFHPLYSIKA